MPANHFLISGRFDKLRTGTPRSYNDRRVIRGRPRPYASPPSVTRCD
jgi:hypothetical protein